MLACQQPPPFAPTSDALGLRVAGPKRPRLRKQDWPFATFRTSKQAGARAFDWPRSSASRRSFTFRFGSSFSQGDSLRHSASGVSRPALSHGRSGPTNLRTGRGQQPQIGHHVRVVGFRPARRENLEYDLARSFRLPHSPCSIVSLDDGVRSLECVIRRSRNHAFEAGISPPSIRRRVHGKMV